MRRPLLDVLPKVHCGLRFVLTYPPPHPQSRLASISVQRQYSPSSAGDVRRICRRRLF
jgi:hypothetical protein